LVKDELAIRAIELKDNLVARFLGISQSVFFYRPKLVNEDSKLKEQILSVLESNPSYGHRRIALALGINKKRVRRVMKQFNIKPYKRKRKWRKRRDERRPEAQFQNLIKGSFPIVPNITWVSDFTYLRFNSRFIYLCTFMDLFTREIVGWSLSTRHTKDLIIEAFFDGFQNQGRLPKFVHSDQGVEYNCHDYTKLIIDLGVTVSMSKKASPWENGYQESFYDNFKTDLGLEFDRFDSIGHFVEAIHQTVNYYNQRRIHTSLKMPPSQFRRQHYLRLAG